jgi:tRNA threonylcarbamoyladenosine biosynthesis protein TsaB
LNTLAVDTSEARGSVALLRGMEAIAVKRHEVNVDYSEWLLPAVAEVLGVSSLAMSHVSVLAVASGPGSFTGLRVGLTSVKAWAEVYETPVVGVSRLEAMASLGVRPEMAQRWVAAYFDAQRNQVFGALYRCASGQLERVDDEVAMTAEEFLALVGQRAGPEPVTWVSLDPQLVWNLTGWTLRAELGDEMEHCEPELATAIGRLAEPRARRGNFTNPLELDANYVRRSDAEILWKGR